MDALLTLRGVGFLFLDIEFIGVINKYEGR